MEADIEASGQTKAAGKAHDRTCALCPLGHKCEVAEINVRVVCAAGNEYQDEEGQETCKSCAACPSGEIRKGCSAASPGYCSSCASGYKKISEFSCDMCGEGTFELSNMQCRTCTAGRYSEAGASGCTHCATGYYQEVKGRGSCKACSGWAHTKGADLDYHGDAGHTGCTAHTTCTDTQYQTDAATATADRECDAHKICTDLEYQTKASGTEHNRECDTITVCKATEYLTKAHTETSNRECAICPKGSKCDSTAATTSTSHRRASDSTDFSANTTTWQLGS